MRRARRADPAPPVPFLGVLKRLRAGRAYPAPSPPAVVPGCARVAKAARSKLRKGGPRASAASAAPTVRREASLPSLVRWVPMPLPKASPHLSSAARVSLAIGAAEAIAWPAA